jgi:hypothetical protein
MKVVLYIQTCYRASITKKNPGRLMMYSVADNAKNEVYEIAQLLINDDTVGL